ncbi:hypothetical protein ACC839_38495, partial [Rhizobium ruizarguesonis]
ENAWKSVGLQAPAGWQDLVDHGIKCFRAPYLSATAGADMIAAEKKAGFSYDASDRKVASAAPLIRPVGELFGNVRRNYYRMYFH